MRFYGHSYLSFVLPSLFTTKAACSERGLNCETSCRCSMPDVVLCIEYSTNMPKSKIIVVVVVVVLYIIVFLEGTVTNLAI